MYSVLGHRMASGSLAATTLTGFPLKVITEVCSIPGNLPRLVRLIRPRGFFHYDRKLETDNNLVENSIRPNALGRKNYLFAGSHSGAQRAAMFCSFFGTCKQQGVNPWKWLKRVLELIPDYPANQLDDLSKGHLLGWIPPASCEIYFESGKQTAADGSLGIEVL